VSGKEEGGEEGVGMWWLSLVVPLRGGSGSRERRKRWVCLYERRREGGREGGRGGGGEGGREGGREGGG